MPLRTRLFLIFGALLALLVLAQWWMTRALTHDLRGELGEVATQAASSTAALFIGDSESDCGETSDDADCVEVRAQHHVELFQVDPGDPHLHFVDPNDGSVPELVRELLDKEPGALPPETIAKLRKLDPKRRPKVLSYSFEVGTGDSQQSRRVEWVSRHLGPGDDVHSTFVALQGPGIRRTFAVSEEGLRDRMEGFSKHLMLGSLAVLLVGLSLAAMVAYRVTRPLDQLSLAARQIGAGALGTQVEAEPGGEVGEALEAFNYMSRRVAQLDAETRRLTARQHLGEIGEIARGLAHSLRNPLNALGLSIEELAGSGETRDPRTRALAESARRQVRRIDDSIRSFLALASQGGGTPEPIDLAALLRDVSLEVLQDGRGRVKIDIPTDLPAAELTGIEAELRAVIQALVVNAAEASPEGGTVEARIDPVETGSGITQYRLQIADRGPGLPPELRERLFTPHLTTKAHGSGMGLYLAQRIAQTRYGGYLDLQDRDGGGTLALLLLGHRADETDTVEQATNG